MWLLIMRFNNQWFNNCISDKKPVKIKSMLTWVSGGKHSVHEALACGTFKDTTETDKPTTLETLTPIFVFTKVILL